MNNVYLLNVGDVVWLKKSTVNKYGFNPDFIKAGKRPFVVGRITDYGAFWLVPSYSNCSDYNTKTEKFYMKVCTPNGDEKFLKFRDMIVVCCKDIFIGKTGSNIISLDTEERKIFEKKFKRIKRMLKVQRERFEMNYYAPYKYEYNIIINDYLPSPYYWLERDYNITDIDRLFSSEEEYKKSSFADELYYNYQNNLKYFLKTRNEYIPNRYAYLFSQFSKTKLEQRYICFTDKGFVKQIDPLEFSENILNSKLLIKEELTHIDISYDTEIRNVEVPMLSDVQKQHVIKELIYLENLIVSEKTYD